MVLRAGFSPIYGTRALQGARGDEVAAHGADGAGRLRQAQLAGEAAGAVEPVGLREDGGATLLDAAVALVEVGMGVERFARGGEDGLDLGAERRLVGLDRER
jgi:hypothetical protein